METTRRCTRCDSVKLIAGNFKRTNHGIGWVCCSCKGRRCCARPGCYKTLPRYGFTKTGERYCRQHKQMGMIDVTRSCCEFTTCTTIPSYNFEGETSGKYCSAHCLPGMVNVKNKRCETAGCVSQPCYNFEGETSGKYCSAHCLPGMFDVINKRCKTAGCTTTPSYNFEGETLREYCMKHKQTGMVNVLNSQCKTAGCTIQPCYNFEGETRGKYCSIHRQPGMVNVVGKRCESTGCTIRPCYNFKGETSGKYCSSHCLPGMVNVKSKRCETAGCETQPCYNFEGETSGKYCSKHRQPGMVIVGSKQCKTLSCTTQATKGFPGHSVARCAPHAAPGMIKYPNSRCTFRHETGRKCTELALYGITQALHCETHQQPGEFNLVEQNCCGCGLLNVVDPQGMCGFCNPENIIRANLAKQRRVQTFLDRRIESSELSDYDSYDRQLDGGECGRERPDFLWDCCGWYVILEVDESQHSDRQSECETVRMKNIAQSLGGPPVWFIRYNPDPYQDSTGDQQDPTQNSRHTKLLQVLNECLSQSPPVHDFITAVYMYYNGFDENSTNIVTVQSMDFVAPATA